MAVSRLLGYYRTGNSAMRSADPKNPNLEPDMEWIGCTVCKIFAFKLYCDLETGNRCHWGSSNQAPLDRPTPKTWPKQTSRRSAKRLWICGHFCIYKMAVSRHLWFYWTANSAIRSADHEKPSLKQTWNGLDALFVRYSPLNYTVTLKLGFRVTQGHRNESGTIP